MPSIFENEELRMRNEENLNSTVLHSTFAILHSATRRSF
jgi:hypothetical protein